jgi:hypothetical protein
VRGLVGRGADREDKAVFMLRRDVVNRSNGDEVGHGPGKAAGWWRDTLKLTCFEKVVKMSLCGVYIEFLFLFSRQQ